jgi:hypothetical protein
MRLLTATTATLAVLASGGTALAADERAQDSWGQKADRICTKIDKEIDRIPAPQDLKGFVTQLPKLKAEGQKEYRLIKALDAPAAQKAKIDAYLATYPKLFKLIDRMVAAARANRSSEFQRLLGQGTPISTKAKKLATQLQAPACAD